VKWAFYSCGALALTQTTVSKHANICFSRRQDAWPATQPTASMHWRCRRMNCVDIWTKWPVEWTQAGQCSTVHNLHRPITCDLGGELSFTALPLNPKRYRNEHC